MILYQAACRTHNFLGNYYHKRHRAVQSAKAHSKNGNNHTIEILEVYIPQESLEIKSKTTI